MNMNHGNKIFFCSTFPHDDITLSDEHYEYGFFTLEEVNNLKNISKDYKRAIRKCMQGKETEYAKRVKIKFGAHGQAGVTSAGTK